MEIHHHPVAGAAKVVRAGGVGEQRGEMPGAALRVQHRQPRLAARIEATRRDQGQRAALGLVAIFTIDIQQHGHIGLDTRALPCRSGAGQHAGKRRTQHCRAPRADAGQRLKPAVVRRDLELFERIDIQTVVNPAGKLWADARHRLEQGFRVDLAAQPLELSPAAGMRHFCDRRGERSPDPGQIGQAVDARARQPADDILVERHQGVGCPAVSSRAERIGALLLQQVGCFAQALGDPLVEPAHPACDHLRSCPRRAAAPDDRLRIERLLPHAHAGGGHCPP